MTEKTSDVLQVSDALSARVEALCVALGPWVLPGWFCTWTFRPRDGGFGEHRREYCERQVCKLLEEWARNLRGRRAARREPLHGLLAWERHASGSWHGHGVVSSPWLPLVPWSPTLKRYLQDAAYERVGITRVFSVDTPGAVAYCLKYALKESATETVASLRWRLIGDVAGASGYLPYS